MSDWFIFRDGFPAEYQFLVENGYKIETTAFGDVLNIIFPDDTPVVVRRLEGLVEVTRKLMADHLAENNLLALDRIAGIP